MIAGMTYSELKELDRMEAIKIVIPGIDDVDQRTSAKFPQFSDVILFGDDRWSKNELIAKFIEDFVKPESEKDISEFFGEIAKRICIDPVLDDTEMRNQTAAEYRLMYKAYMRLYGHPDSLSDWSEQKGTFIWFEYILSKKRYENFLKIKKEQDNEKLREITKKIQDIYNFSDREIIYLHYFCSQTKLDDLDASLNTVLYIWSVAKFTGKTTVSEYLCSFLNGETTKNAEAHKSTLAIEMQMERFDIPMATSSRCTFLDEAGFYDMTKSYEKFKSMITSNSCIVEYKYKNSKRTKKCNRNYIMASNVSPIYLIKDEDERRVLSIEFKIPKQIGFDELSELWYEFVLECNLSTEKLTQIYHEIIKPNSQSGDSKNIMCEMRDIFSRDRINNCTNTGYFNVINTMQFPEVITQKLSRKLVKEVLIKLYGNPDSAQRFYKNNRVIEVGVENIELPF